MTISPNRIRYLDKENKVLVQDFSDVGANVPMTNVDTPMTIEAMDAIDEGFRILQSLERDLFSIVNALTNENIGRYLVDTLLNNLRLNLPGFPGVNAFVNSLRGMDPAIFGGFINALISEVSQSIFDNPSVINRKAGNTQQQVVNIALTNFSRKLQSGQVDQAYINRLANYGTSDPYAINAAVNKLNTDYNYSVNEQAKFKLPKDTRVADTLICFMSLSLAYYNYLYSKIKLDDKNTISISFILSLETGTDGYSVFIDGFKSELSKSSVDYDSVCYYAEQMTKQITYDALTKIKSLDYDVQAALFNKYLATLPVLMTSSLTAMKQKLTTSVYDPYKSPATTVYVGNVISRIKAGVLVLDGTLDPSVYTAVSSSLKSEFESYLKSNLLSHLRTGKKSKDIQNVYTLINARHSFYKTALELRSTLTKVQWTTLFSVLEVLYSIDIYALEGDTSLLPYQIRLTSPISTYTKVTTEKFYKTCFEFLKLMNRQFYVSYPKEGSVGLISNLVEKMNQVRMDLVMNHFSIQNVINNINSAYQDLVPVLTGSVLHSAFMPIYYNSYDSDIYTLYKRDLGKFVFGSEDVTVVP